MTLRDITNILLIVAFSFSLSKASMSATQGAAGSTSTGTLDISIALADVVQISSLNDIIFPVWGGTGGMIEFDDLCIYSNTAGGGYNVTATGSGSGSAFTVTDGSNTMAYNASWNDVSGTNTGMASLTTNVALTSQTGASTNSLDCSSGASLTSRIIIEFIEATLMGAPVSVYSGTLTFNIAPE
jgi:hypothetical protein